MARWKIFYGDGTTFSDQEGQSIDAPIANVQVIVQESIESGHYVQATRDYYVYWPDRERWVGVDIAGVLDFLVERSLLFWGDEIDSGIIIQRAVNTGLVKLGRTMAKEDFYALYARADKDPYLPKRTGYRAQEWKPGDSTN